MKAAAALCRSLTVPLCAGPQDGAGRARSSPWLYLLLLGCGAVLATTHSVLLALASGLFLLYSSARWLLLADYRYALRIERGRLSLLRNGVAIFDTSVLAGDGPRLLLQEDRLEAVRCGPAEAHSFIFGIPILRLRPGDVEAVRERLHAEAEALDSLPRQLELLDDPDVQMHLLSRLRAARTERQSGLHAELLRLSQGGSDKAGAAQSVLLRSQGRNAPS